MDDIRNERDKQKRHEYIRSMVQLGRAELFDELITETEMELTSENIKSTYEFTEELKERGFDPLIIYQEATFMDEETFYEDNRVEWSEAIENALNFYAVNRKHNRDFYERALKQHPYVGPVE